MRFLLILFCLVGLAVAGWHALTMGTPFQSFRGAPQIEAKVRDDVLMAIEPVRTRPIEVSADGLNVHLS